MKNTIWEGANWQFGYEIKFFDNTYANFDFILTDIEDFPLDQSEVIISNFKRIQPDIVINCAAYTVVDKAESEKVLVYKINAEAPGIIAKACKENNVRLIHISTDYVFSGMGTVPYKEGDATDPVNLYGDSKLQGEKKVMEFNPDSIIIRTSWVYSEFGKNFVKTIETAERVKAERILGIDPESGKPVVVRR